MKLQKIDLNLLRVFDIIYRERSLTQASEVLCITQPAVSNALRRLRETLGSQLFIATPQGMVPTSEADRLITKVREALNLLRSAVNELSTFDPEKSTKAFRFSMNDFSEALILPSLMATLQIEAPNMSIASNYISRGNAERELSIGQLDFVIDAPLSTTTSLRFSPLIEEPYVCAMNPECTIAEKRMTLNAYLDSDHVHVSSRRYGRGQMDIALDKLGYQRRIALRVQHYLIAGRVAAQNNLLWTVPRALVTPMPLKVKKLPFEVTPMECQLYWHANAAQDPANVWMRKKLQDIVGKLNKKH